MARVIGEWLTEIGLGKYAETFLANDIDLDVLPDLDDLDLERLGVSLGHRKKLLRPSPTCLQRRPSGRVATVPARQPSPSAAERRQLTVMFVDLVGSTEPAAALIPK